MEKYKLQPLDLWIANFLTEDNTALYFFIRLAKKPNIENLKRALEATSKIVPEVFCRFDRSKGCFVKSHWSAEDLISEVSGENAEENFPHIHLSTGPLIGIVISPCIEEEGYELKLIISHIICDGGGFIDYVGLLCHFYNNPEDTNTEKFENLRDMQILMKNFKRKKIGLPPEVKKVLHLSGKTMVPMNLSEAQNFYQSDRVEFFPSEMEQIKAKSRKLKITFNDLLLSSLACTLHKYSSEELIVLGCPADLRAFFKDSLEGKLTINNFSSFYHCPTYINEQSTFDSVLESVISTMTLLKSMNSCMNGTMTLYDIYRIFPFWISRMILKNTVSKPNILYSNVGVIDQTKIHFNDNEVKWAAIGGPFNKAPGVRITISTFKGKCSMVSDTIGTEENHLLIIEIMEDMKKRILDWSKE